jgi:hypothetical protein
MTYWYFELEVVLILEYTNGYMDSTVPPML